jgi:integrase
LLAQKKHAPSDGPSLMRAYTSAHLLEVAAGGSGRKRNLLDVARFLTFAVKKCGADRKWRPLEADDLKELIGHRQTAPKPTAPIKPQELITLLTGLESDPSLRLAVGLVALFGLRPAELMVMTVEDGNLKIGNVKRNAHSSATPKPPRTVQELPLKEFQGEGARLVQLFQSGLVKLPKSIRNLDAGAFKACGHTFRQYLDRNATWQSLKASNPELTPYSLRHGYAWRAAKYYPQPLPLRDTAKLMGHDLKTHIRHYWQWTDDASTKSAVEASIKSLLGAS